MDLKNYIKVYRSVCSANLCLNLVEQYKNGNWQKAELEGMLNTGQRMCKHIYTSGSESFSHNPGERIRLDELLHREVISPVLRSYMNEFPDCDVTADTGYDLLKYDIGDYYSQHVDSFSGGTRVLTASVVLNNDYKGGLFSFFSKKLQYELNLGDAIIFPANFMFPHEITPITEGTRYAIVTWFT